MAYNFSESWALALEHHADYRQLCRLEPPSRRRQTLFAVVDYKADPLSVEFGIGHGFAAASDALILIDAVARHLSGRLRAGCIQFGTSGPRL